MAETVTWPLLRELASFRAVNGCAISLYVNLDPSEVPTSADAQSRVNALLTSAEKTDRSDLTHDQRGALKADLERIERWFDDDFERDRSQGVAVFAAGLDNFWSTLSLPEPVPDRVNVARELYLVPLIPAVAQADGTIVAVVGREQGQLFRLRAGRLEEIAEHFDEQPGQHDQGGWSQSRYKRHIEKLVQEHLKGVAEELDRSRRRLHAPKIVLVCSEEMRSEFMDELPPPAGSKPSKQPPTAGSTCCSSRKAPIDLPSGVPPAAGLRLPRAPARLMGRASSRSTVESTSPCTRRSRTAVLSGRSATTRILRRSGESELCCATNPSESCAFARHWYAASRCLGCAGRGIASVIRSGSTSNLLRRLASAVRQFLRLGRVGRDARQFL